MLFTSAVFDYNTVVQMIRNGFFMSENDIEQIRARFLPQGITAVLTEQQNLIKKYKEGLRVALLIDVLTDVVLSYVMVYKNPPLPKFFKNEDGKWVQKDFDIDAYDW